MFSCPKSIKEVKFTKVNSIEVNLLEETKIIYNKSLRVAKNNSLKNSLNQFKKYFIIRIFILNIKVVARIKK